MEGILNFIFHALPIFIGGMIALAVVAVVSAMIVIRFSKKDPAKRRRELEAFATERGLRFAPDGSPALANRISRVEPFKSFVMKQTANVMEGVVGGRTIVLFDYMIGSVSESSTSRSGAVKSREVDFYHSGCLHDLKVPYPDLVIRPKRLDDKVLKEFGCEDIAFESDDFTRAFRVRSADRKFAYDVCNPRMMELLLANRRWHVQLTDGLFILLTDRESRPEELSAALDFAGRFLDFVPEFVRKEYAQPVATP